MVKAEKFLGFRISRMIERINHNISIIIVILFCMSCIGFAEEVKNVRINLESKAVLYLDSCIIGEDSVFELRLAPNKYKIDLIFSANNSWNRISIDTTVGIVSDTVLVFPTPTMTLIYSKPSDASVYLNSQLFGLTPYYLNMNLLNDRDSLFIKKENYLTKYISPNELQTNLMYDLELDKSLNNNFINKNIKYILLGSAVVFGSLSAYFKQEANKYFYSEEPSEHDSRLVKKYDNYSAIFSGMLQVNFGVLVYLLLSE